MQGGTDVDSPTPEGPRTTGYRLEVSESVADGVRRMAHEEVGGALARLREPRYDANEALHDARTRLRKVRALLRLVQDSIGPDVFSPEDQDYAAAAALLDDARESYVAVRTVADLREDFSEVLRPSAFLDLQSRLEERHHRILHHTLREGVVPEVIERVEAAERRIDSWPLDSADDRELERSVRRTYERGYAAMSRAFNGGSKPGSFEEWREEARYLWFLYRVLVPAWPPIFEAMAEEQLRLASSLGVGMDLGHLADLADDDSLADTPWPRLALRGLARERQVHLWGGLRPLGRRLYAETPDAFRDRMHRILEAARGPSGAAH
jgi:hypothetical protein